MKIFMPLAFAFALGIVIAFILMPPMMIAANSTSQNEAGGGGRIIPGSFIITLKPDFVDADSANDMNPSNNTLKKQEQQMLIKTDQINRELEQQGGNVTNIYDSAILGFAVSGVSDLTPLLNDSAIETIEANTEQELDKQYQSTGIGRIGLNNAVTAAFKPDSRETLANIDVAVIDTIVYPHPDLNIFRSVDFQPQADASLEIHGTHVAGLCCARDNLGGVVGPAQGARIWNLQVCGGESGQCSSANMISAADHIVSNAGSIEIATMSIGGGNVRSTALRDAIASVWNAGVTFFQSGGNEASECESDWGCAMQASTSIVVAAMTDYDGKCGGLRNLQSASGATLRDDIYATYSNWGSQMDILAPGTSVLSTWPVDPAVDVSASFPYIGVSGQGEYASISGTSMATPLAAGVGALVKIKNPSFTPSQIQSSLQTNAYGQNQACDGASKGGLVTGANQKDSSKLLWAQPY